MRLDLLLMRLRFVRSRGQAQHCIAEGHIRRNRHRATKPSQPVEVSDVLTLPLAGATAGAVVVIEILALPVRRGPAREAQEHYRVLDQGWKIALAGRQQSPVGP